MASSRTSRVYTISLPPELAQKAEGLAADESRSMSELFREAFRVYWAQHVRRAFEATEAYAATRNPHGYTEEDIPRLIQEVRQEVRSEERAEIAANEAARSLAHAK